MYFYGNNQMTRNDVECIFAAVFFRVCGDKAFIAGVSNIRQNWPGKDSSPAHQMAQENTKGCI